MRHDFTIFILLAVGIHIAAAATPNTGSESSGGGGEALVSLQGANAQAAMMVQEWDRSPDVSDMVVRQHAPQVEPPPPDMSSTETAAQPTPVPAMETPESFVQDQVNVETVDSLLMPSLQSEETLEMSADPSPSLTMASVIQAPDMPETTFQPPETHVQGMTVPALRPESIAENHPVADRTQVATQALQSQQAAGEGAAPQAGAANATEAISEGQHAELVQVWGGQIRRAIERHKRYPRKAQSRGERGAVTVSVSVDTGGRLVSYNLVGSAGSQLLDNAAIEAVTRAGQFPAAPTGLNGNSFSFRFRIVFE